MPTWRRESSEFPIVSTDPGVLSLCLNSVGSALFVVEQDVTKNHIMRWMP